MPGLPHEHAPVSQSVSLAIATLSVVPPAPPLHQESVLPPPPKSRWQNGCMETFDPRLRAERFDGEILYPLDEGLLS